MHLYEPDLEICIHPESLHFDLGRARAAAETLKMITNSHICLTSINISPGYYESLRPATA